MNNKRIYYDFEFCDKRIHLSRKFVIATKLVELYSKTDMVDINREMESIAYEVIKQLLDYGIVSSMEDNVINCLGFCLIETYYFRDIIITTLEQLSRCFEKEEFDTLCFLNLIKYNINGKKCEASKVIISFQIIYSLFEYLQIDDKSIFNCYTDYNDLLNSILDVNMSTPCFEWYRSRRSCKNNHIHSIEVRDIHVTKTKIREQLNKNKQLKLYNTQLLRMIYKKDIIPSSLYFSDTHVSITTVLYNIRIK